MRRASGGSATTHTWLILPVSVVAGASTARVPALTISRDQARRAVDNLLADGSEVGLPVPHAEEETRDGC